MDVAGFEISPRARAMLGANKLKLAAQRCELDLVIVTPKAMGLSCKAPFWAVCAEAEVQGLLLCQEEVGPQLRLQYSGQPREQRLMIGMQPLGNTDGYVFFLSRTTTGQGSLECDFVYMEEDLLPDTLLIFRLR